MEIHQLSATSLRAALDAGELRSVEIVDALIARREAVDGQVRGWVHRFDEQARAQAAAADQQRDRGEAHGLLHGIPMSIKENLATAGHAQTMGIKALQATVAKADAAVVATARDAGAIVLGKSNIPLLLLAMETHNDIWGTTHNPWDAARSPGGSSGGEGALIATGQAPLGIGTDIGGSIRIPAAWCGICGLKPTLGRWSVKGSAGGIPGQEIVRATTGPLARTVDDLVLLCQALAPQAQRRHDPRVPPLAPVSPASVPLAGMRVGFYEVDPVFPPCPAVRRAVRTAAEALEAAGCTLVEVQPGDSWELVDTYFGGVSGDGAATARDRMQGQGPTGQLATLFTLARIPGPLRPVVAAALEARGEVRAARLLRAFGNKPAQQLFALAARRSALQQAELERWDADRIDLLICPPTVTPPALRDQTHDWSLGAWYTMRYNILDLPAGIVPVSTVRDDEQAWPDPADRLDRKADSFLRGSAGLPLTVQVVARPWQEERVLAGMAAIEAALRLAPDYPRTPIDPRG